MANIERMQPAIETVGIQQISDSLPLAQRMRRRQNYKLSYRPTIDDASNWSTSTQYTLSNDTTLVRSSLANPQTSVRVTKNNGISTVCQPTHVFAAPVDLTNKLVRIRWYMGGTISTTTKIQLFLISGAGSNYGYHLPMVASGAATNHGPGWFEIFTTTNQFYATAGTFDISAITSIMFKITYSSNAATDEYVVIDDISFFDPPTAPARLFIAFDDGKANHLYAARYLAAKGLRANFFIIPQRCELETSGYLTLAEAKEIQAMGHLICNHSWSHAYWITAGFTEQQKRDEVYRAADYLTRNGMGRGALIFGHPGGAGQCNQSADNFFLDKLDLMRLGGSYGSAYDGIGPNYTYLPTSGTADNFTSGEAMLNALSITAKMDTVQVYHEGDATGVEAYIDAVAAAHHAGTIRCATLDELVYSEV